MKWCDSKLSAVDAQTCDWGEWLCINYVDKIKLQIFKNFLLKLISNI